jgi:hypothetical protein
MFAVSALKSGALALVGVGSTVPPRSAFARLLTHFSTLRIHVRPARSIFSNALNFCRSAIAALVRSP